jgi:hypothetical protein
MDTSRSPIPLTSGAPESVQERSGFRTKSIGTRVTPEELRLIEAAAERDGKKFAEWMREAVLKAAAGPPADTGEPADSRKRVTARKLLEEFRASVKPSGSGR